MVIFATAKCSKHNKESGKCIIRGPWIYRERNKETRRVDVGFIGISDFKSISSLRD